MTRSRGCTRQAATSIAADVFDEIRALVEEIEADERAVEPAVRLAGIIRREAIADRHVLAQARTDEPELVPALERLCLRRR